MLRKREQKKTKEPEDREVCSEMLSFRYVPADIAMNTQALQTSSLDRTIQLPIMGDREPMGSQSFLRCSRLPVVPGGKVAIFSHGVASRWEEECDSEARKGDTRG